MEQNETLFQSIKRRFNWKIAVVCIIIFVAIPAIIGLWLIAGFFGTLYALFRTGFTFNGVPLTKAGIIGYLIFGSITYPVAFVSVYIQKLLSDSKKIN